MYAELNELDQLVDGKPVKNWYKSDSFYYTVDGINYTAPHNWFHEWDIAEKNTRHIFVMVSNQNDYDPDEQHVSGVDPTYTFDGSTVTETYTFIANDEPASLDKYKAKNTANTEGKYIYLVQDKYGEQFQSDVRGTLETDSQMDPDISAMITHRDGVIVDINAAADYDAVDAAVEGKWPIEEIPVSVTMSDSQTGASIVWAAVINAPTYAAKVDVVIHNSDSSENYRIAAVLTNGVWLADAGTNPSESSPMKFSLEIEDKIAISITDYPGDADMTVEGVWGSDVLVTAAEAPAYTGSFSFGHGHHTTVVEVVDGLIMTVVEG